MLTVAYNGYMERPRINFADNLKARILRQKEIKRGARNANLERYEIGLGDYDRPLFDVKAEWDREKQRDKIPLAVDQLRGMEETLYETIQELLKKRSGQPVVAIDIGGMRSLSFVRLALKLQNEIAQGKVVLAVSNLAFNPDAPENPRSKDRIFIDDEKVFWQKHRHLVHFIQANIAELQKRAVTLPDGRLLPLKGHLDVVHERCAMMHGYVNDVDLALIARNVSRDGFFFLNSTWIQEFNEKDPLAPSREAAHTIGMKNLVAQGLVPFTPPEKMTYRVYTGADAVDIASKILHPHQPPPSGE